MLTFFHFSSWEEEGRGKPKPQTGFQFGVGEGKGEGEGRRGVTSPNPTPLPLKPVSAAAFYFRYCLSADFPQEARAALDFCTRRSSVLSSSTFRSSTPLHCLSGSSNFSSTSVLLDAKLFTDISSVCICSGAAASPAPSSTL